MDAIIEVRAAILADAADSAIEDRDNAQAKVKFALTDTRDYVEHLKTALRQMPNPFRR